MKIYCKKCGKYLGEIRDATLRKHIVYFCSHCYTAKQETYSSKSVDDLAEMLGIKL